jgi:adenylate cyclase
LKTDAGKRAVQKVSAPLAEVTEPQVINEVRPTSVIAESIAQWFKLLRDVAAAFFAEQKSYALIAAALAIILALVLGARQIGVGAAEPPGVLVLPFEDLTAAKSQNQMSSAIAADLSAGLSKIANVRVIAAPFVLRGLTGQNGALQHARDNSVRFVIEGAIWNTPKGLNVKGELIDVASAETLWAKTLTLEQGDSIALEAVPILGHSLSLKLNSILSAPGSPNAETSEVERLIHQADDFGEQFAEEDASRVHALLTNALKKYPDNVDIAIKLARNFLISKFYNWKLGDGSYSQVAARKLVKRSLEKAPAYIPALYADCLYLGLEHDYAGAVSACRKILQFDPWYAYAYNEIAFDQLNLCLFDAAIQSFMSAESLDKTTRFRAAIYSGIGRAFLMSGKTAEAITWLKRSTELAPGQPVALGLLVAALGLENRSGEAEVPLQALLKLRTGLPIASFIAFKNGSACFDQATEKIALGLSQAGVRD